MLAGAFGEVSVDLGDPGNVVVGKLVPFVAKTLAHPLIQLTAVDELH